VSKSRVVSLDAQAPERLTALRQHMSGAVIRKPNRVSGTHRHNQKSRNPASAEHSHARKSSLLLLNLQAHDKIIHAIDRYQSTILSEGSNLSFPTPQAQEKSDNARPLRLMERSVFSDRMVFVRAVHEAKFMSDMEISIYDSWFDPIVSGYP
jgi:hypothetical protein